MFRELFQTSACHENDNLQRQRDCWLQVYLAAEVATCCAVSLQQSHAASLQFHSTETWVTSCCMLWRWQEGRLYISLLVCVWQINFATCNELHGTRSTLSYTEFKTSEFGCETVTCTYPSSNYSCPCDLLPFNRLYFLYKISKTKDDIFLCSLPSWMKAGATGTQLDVYQWRGKQGERERSVGRYCILKTEGKSGSSQ